MPILTKQDLEVMEKAVATIMEVRPGVWQGPWIKDLYDDRRECLFANIDFKRNESRKAAGQNEQGQTPKQEESFKKRLMVAEANREKAAILEHMMIQQKLGQGALKGQVFTNAQS